jgi:hypothetical protein
LLPTCRPHVTSGYWDDIALAGLTALPESPLLVLGAGIGSFLPLLLCTRPSSRVQCVECADFFSRRGPLLSHGAHERINFPDGSTVKSTPYTRCDSHHEGKLTASDEKRVTFDEKAFRFGFNADPRTVEKTAEGIWKFSADTHKLEKSLKLKGK